MNVQTINDTATLFFALLLLLRAAETAEASWWGVAELDPASLSDLLQFLLELLRLRASHVSARRTRCARAMHATHMLSEEVLAVEFVMTAAGLGWAIRRGA